MAIISGSSRGIGEAIVRIREEQLDAKHPAGHIDEPDYLHDISNSKKGELLWLKIPV